MAVKFYRMRSGAVHSFNRLAYGVENNSLKPATYVVEGTKRRYLFSEVGAGVYPVMITGDSANEIVQHLSQASGVRFTIRGQPLGDDEDDFDAMLTRELERKTGHSAHHSTNSMEGFSIHCKWQVWNPTKKAIEIHDGGMGAFKNVALFAGGLTGAGIAEGLSSGGTTSTSLFNTGVNIFKGLVGAAPDVYDIGSTLKGGGGGSNGARIGIMVHYLPLSGGKDTGHTNIAARKIARIATRIWPG
jgi:hypothetical protein